MLSVDPARALTRTRLRVRFCETDLMGIVHHAAYLPYFEAGRVEWLRRRGVTYADWAARGMHLPVIEANVRYRAPARFDDVVVIETRLAELRAASLRFEYAMRRESGAGDGDRFALLAEGFTRLACVDERHAVRRFSEEMLAVLRSPETPETPETPESRDVLA